MATSDILGLFMSPEQYQAQQKTNELDRAFNFAQLSPRDQAVYSMFLGGQQLARGLGGLLGVQDPQLQRIRQREEIMRSINPADMASLTAGIQRASQMGDQELALSLTDFMRKQGSEIALAQQRTAAANKERTQALPAGIQEAARIAEIERTLVGLPKESTEYIALTAEKARLQKSVKAAGLTEKQREAAAYADTVSDNPDSSEWKEAYKTRLDRLQLGKSELEFKLAQARPLIAKRNDLLLQGYSPDSREIRDVEDELSVLGVKREVPKETQAPERVRILEEIRARKDEQKKLPPDSEEYKAIQEDIDYLENRREGRQPNVSAAVDEIALEKFSKPYLDLTSQERTQVRNIQKDEAKKQTDISYGVDREATAKAEFGKRFDDLDQTQQKFVNKLVEAERRINAPKVEIHNVLPKQPIDIANTEKAIRETVEPQLKTVTSVNSALATLDLAKRENNPSAFNATKVQLAKSLGDSMVSAADIKNAGGDPSIFGSLRDIASTAVFGTPGNPTLDDVRKTLLALRKVARKQATDTLNRQKRLAESATYNDRTKVYTDQQIKDLFNFPDLNPEAESAGGNKPLSWKDLKANTKK